MKKEQTRTLDLVMYADCSSAQRLNLGMNGLVKRFQQCQLDCANCTANLDKCISQHLRHHSSAIRSSPYVTHLLFHTIHSKERIRRNSTF